MQNEARKVAQGLFFYYTSGWMDSDPFYNPRSWRRRSKPFKKLTVGKLFKNFPSL
jgi:hypothetical protein